jgi:hypothetical protein
MGHSGSLRAPAGCVERTGLLSEFSYEKAISAQAFSGTNNQYKISAWRRTSYITISPRNDSSAVTAADSRQIDGYLTPWQQCHCPVGLTAGYGAVA